MRRIIPVVLCILAFSAIALAQASSPDIDKALMPLPARLKAAATVIKWKSDFTYDTLRKGTNPLVCYDRSGQPGQKAFAVECTSLTNLNRVAQSLKIEATAGDAKAVRAAFEDLEKAGKWTKPEFGSIWYHMSGADAGQANTHLTVAVPGATNKTLGLPEDGKQGGTWIMNAGTSAAHLMINGE
ncbi:MAG TPA: hypothetical protein VGK48_21360 [Terriglobia bacterium]|jgi:hypothetical protein